VELLRSPRARVIEQGEALYVAGADGSLRRFDGPSAALAKAVLQALDAPTSRDALLATLADQFEDVASAHPLVDELLGHLRRAGAVTEVATGDAPPLALAGLRVVVLGSGAVAAAFLPDLVAQLQQRGAEVRAGLTRSARRFVAPGALEALTHHRVPSSLWDFPPDAPAPHVQLAEWADVVVVAPASATTLSRLARGDCGELCAAVVTATRAPVLVVPSMNPTMLRAPAVQRNLEALARDGCFVCWPSSGLEVAHGPTTRRLVRGPMLPAAELAALVATWAPHVTTAASPTGARFWDALYHSGATPWQRAALEAPLAEALAACVRGRLLDVGTGLGLVAAEAARLGFEVVATDLSPVALAAARARHPAARVTWLEDDLLASRLWGVFDVVVDRAVLHVLPRAEREAWARFMLARLAPAGRLLVVAHGPAASSTLRTQAVTRADLLALLPGLTVLDERACPVTDAATDDAVLYVLARR
jgi:protein-L-isoaspartate O-methyltransferase/3-polyprenyl-4-hydroxybenzoate decarboxylase